ncbi:S49 family peptidase [Biomphalaria pfeifferi]|uniref:S49 family peptidase n=1 Tax=Biomphalaria pfeifferi TaxID=112525 RepID=A0AAD8ANC4_BIOPF|nr:S49 family peptidase [Biomphalaria pfeifferi]
MIALHADKIIAGKYSLVGSIGAVMQPWQLDRAIGKLDVSQRVYASGKLKSFLNPYIPVTPEADAKAQHLVDQAGAAFLAEVKARRGSALKSGTERRNRGGLVRRRGQGPLVSSTRCLPSRPSLSPPGGFGPTTLVQRNRPCPSSLGWFRTLSMARSNVSLLPVLRFADLDPGLCDAVHPPGPSHCYRPRGCLGASSLPSAPFR